MSKLRTLIFIIAGTFLLSILSCENLGHTINNLNGALDWVKTWGGTSNDIAFDILVDNDFNVYVIGTFKGNIDFDPGTGIDKHVSTGGTTDCFIVKFNSVGDYGWTKTWNAKTIEDAKIDSDYNIFVTGEFEGTVDMHPGALDVDNHTSIGGDDCYLTKFDHNGNYQWARTWGGSNHDNSNGIAVDSFFDIYVAGAFQETVDFNTSGGFDNRSSNGFTDCFLTKFDTNGTWLWVGNWGGTGIDYAYCADADKNNNIYAGGVYQNNVDFNPSASIENHQSNGDWDCFLSKFNSVGNFAYAKSWGSTGDDSVDEIALDSNNNIFVAGSFSGSVDFDPGVGSTTGVSNGWKDCFLSKFTPAGSFQYVKTFGGSGSDFGLGVAVDTSNNVYFCGSFKETVDFNPNVVSRIFTAVGGSDCFVTSYDNSGNFKDVAVWGGDGDDGVTGIGADWNDEPFVSGYFNGKCDFDTTTTTAFVQSNGGSDCFLAKFK